MGNVFWTLLYRQKITVFALFRFLLVTLSNLGMPQGNFFYNFRLRPYLAQCHLVIQIYCAFRCLSVLDGSVDVQVFIQNIPYHFKKAIRYNLWCFSDKNQMTKY